MNDGVEEQVENTTTKAKQDDPSPGRRPWTDAEKAQIRMLLRTLGVILVMVVLALGFAVIVSRIIY